MTIETKIELKIIYITVLIYWLYYKYTFINNYSKYYRDYLDKTSHSWMLSEVNGEAWHSWLRFSLVFESYNWSNFWWFPSLGIIKSRANFENRSIFGFDANGTHHVRAAPSALDMGYHFCLSVIKLLNFNEFVGSLLNIIAFWIFQH